MPDPILVTGVAGFIGLHVAKRLLDGGQAVAGVENLNDDNAPRPKHAYPNVRCEHPIEHHVRGQILVP